MTSITQLLSPWPSVTKQSIVLREHYMPPPQNSHLDSMQQAEPSSPNDPSADGVTGSAESDGGDGPDGRKGYGKRELSTSKRAAQNRAAQVGQGAMCSCIYSDSALESIQTTERGLHQEARRTGSGLSDPQRELQGCASRELPASRLYHQPSVQVARITRRGPASSKQRRRFATRKGRSTIPDQHSSSTFRTRCCWQSAAS